MSDRPAVLAAAAARGDFTVCLTEPVPDVCAITIEPGTPHQEWIRVYQCLGDGPHVARLGLSESVRVSLAGPHPVGSPVKVEYVDD